MDRRILSFRRSLTCSILLALVAAGLGTSTVRPAEAARPSPTATIELVNSFDWTFSYGIAYGFLLGPASDIAPYVVEVSPVDPAINGAFFSTRVQQEFNGVVWNDVARVQLLPEGQSGTVTANVRIFRLGAR